MVCIINETLLNHEEESILIFPQDLYCFFCHFSQRWVIGRVLLMGIGCVGWPKSAKEIVCCLHIYIHQLFLGLNELTGIRMRTQPFFNQVQAIYPLTFCFMQFWS